MESNTRVIQRIEELRHTTESNILFHQKHLVPSYVDLNPKLVWDAYYIAGNRFTITSIFKFALIVYNMPFNETVINNREDPYYTDWLENMIKRNEINPIFIFYDNRFIPWSKIKVVKDIRTTYLLLGDEDGYDKLDTLKCITFPFNIDYREDLDDSIRDNYLFRFNKNGLLDLDNGTIGASPMDPCVFSKICTSTESIYQYNVYTGGDIELSDEYSISKENCSIVFKDGVLDSEASIKVNKHGLLTIDDGNQDYDIISFAFIYSLKTSTNKYSHSFKISNKKELIESSENSTITTAEKLLLNKLDFQFSLDKLYEDNIADALKTIMKYDSEIMDKVYTDLSKIDSLECTGKQLKKHAKNNYIYLNEIRRKQNDNGTETLIKVHPMIFVNNRLYKYTRAITKVNTNIKIPIIDIADDDSIEILLFKEIINDVYPAGKHTVTTNEQNYDYVTDVATEEVLNDLDDLNLELYTSSNPLNSVWNMTSVDEYDRVQFKLIAEYIKENNGKIGFNVNLGKNEKFYGDIPLTVVSKKQFRYMGFVTNRPRINFALTPEFNFCLNKNQYMVFINGKRLEQSDFILISAAKNQPFDDISIYMNHEMEPGDIADVFYLPVAFNEFAIAPRIPVSGNIYLDKDQFDYGFNKNLHLIFINGDKIASSKIVNVNSSKIHIDDNINTLNNLCVLQHVRPISVLNQLFYSRQSEWDTIMDSFDYSKISNILGYKNKNIVDKDADYNEWKLSDVEVTTEIARDYWLSKRIYFENTGYNYDYNDIIIDGKDFDGYTVNRLRNAMIDYYRNNYAYNVDIADEELDSITSYSSFRDQDDQIVLDQCMGYADMIFETLNARLDHIIKDLNTNIATIDINSIFDEEDQSKTIM